MTEITEELAYKLPIPKGYRILVKMPVVKDTFEDSVIVKVDKTKEHDNVLSMVGYVIELGPQAYLDPDRFPTGAWCTAGDYVMFRANTGTRFKVNGHEYRLINDDSVEAIVNDPTAIQRAY